MTKRHRLIVWLLPLALVVTFAVLSLLANAWLASSGGKAKLEDEFSSSLGYTVQLTGDFRVSLFPRIAIRGSGFELYAPQGRRLLARAEDYSAAIELLPFLHRVVQIDSVALRGGFLDLGTFMAQESGALDSTQTTVSIPHLNSVTIEEFSLVFSDEDDIVALKRVDLEGFEIGREARLVFEGSWLSGGIEVAGLALQGGLYAGPALGSARLAVNQLDLKFGDTDISGFSGAWEWDKTTAQISGEMNWIRESASAHSKIELSIGESTSGGLVASYTPSLESPPGKAEVTFALTDERLDFPEVSLEWNGQTVSGSGCYSFTAPAGLYFSLFASTLDLDAIGASLPAGGASDHEFPSNVALDLHVESANYSGAKARNVDVKIGGDRSCDVDAASEPGN